MQTLANSTTYIQEITNRHLAHMASQNETQKAKDYSPYISRTTFKYVTLSLNVGLTARDMAHGKAPDPRTQAPLIPTCSTSLYARYHSTNASEIAKW